MCVGYKDAGNICLYFYVILRHVMAHEYTMYNQNQLSCHGTPYSIEYDIIIGNFLSLG